MNCTILLQDVSGQVILITGGGGGVGAHLARNFGKLNAKVIIWDVNSDGKRKKNQISKFKNFKLIKKIYISCYLVVIKPWILFCTNEYKSK